MFVKLLAIVVVATNSYAEAPGGLPSPCYAQNKREQMANQDMFKKMREMRPAPNAQIQRLAQTQTQSRMDYASQASALTAPYVARANGIRSAAAGCADVACASNVHNQASAFLADVTNNLLPQLRAMMQDMQKEMTSSTAMSVDRLDEIYKMNAGSALPSSRGGTYFPPLCNDFQKVKLNDSPFGWAAFRPPPVGSFKNIKDWNEKNGQGLGEWSCVGSLAMGNVRCFKRENDPQGMGRSCEKVKGQVTACYDNIALWTPVSTNQKSQEANWASWFDKPPPLLRVMVGGVVVEERKSEEIFKEKEIEAKEMKLIAPLLRPTEERAGAMGPIQDVPLPWEVFETKIRSGKGLSPADLKNMTDADWSRYYQLKQEMHKDNQKSDLQLATEQTGVAVKIAVDEKVTATANWAKTNEEHIESTIEMMETMAFIAGPIGGEAIAGIEATAKAATIASKMLIVRANNGGTTDYAKELVLLLGPEQIEKLGKKAMFKSVQLGGFTPDQAKNIVEEAEVFAGLIDKARSVKGEK